jgi:hypothetical protein
MHFQRDGEPPYSVDKWRSTWMSSSLTWIGRGGPQTWPQRSPDLPPFHVWSYMKNMEFGRKVNKRGTTPSIFRCYKTDVICEMNLESDIRSSSSVENLTYFHMTFLTGNDLTSKIRKYWPDTFVKCYWSRCIKFVILSRIKPNLQSIHLHCLCVTLNIANSVNEK